MKLNHVFTIEYIFKGFIKREDPVKVHLIAAFRINNFLWINKIQKSSHSSQFHPLFIVTLIFKLRVQKLSLFYLLWPYYKI